MTVKYAYFWYYSAADFTTAINVDIQSLDGRKSNVRIFQLMHNDSFYSRFRIFLGIWSPDKILAKKIWRKGGGMGHPIKSYSENSEMFSTL